MSKPTEKEKAAYVKLLQNTKWEQFPIETLQSILNTIIHLNMEKSK